MSSKVFKKSTFVLGSIVGFIYLFLYMPIIVLIVFSFNKSTFGNQWVGFTWEWYHALFNSPEILSAAYNSLIVAISGSFLSTALGVLWLFYSQYSRLSWLNSIFYGGLFIPEIIFALGLLLFFTTMKIQLGIATLIIGHTGIGLGYVIPLLSNRYNHLDKELLEASFDLGAGLHQTFFKVIIPALSSSLFAAFLLTFIISFDDFLIAFFCSGGSVQTLSLYIFSMIRTGVSPTINALSTVLIGVSSIIVLLVSCLGVFSYADE